MKPLEPDTPLARFAAGNDIRAEKKPRVKVRFMMPRAETGSGRLALSTFRVDRLTPEGKRRFGEEWVREHLGADRRLKAHCELPVHAFESAGLRTDYDDNPPRHVNVLGWSDEPDARLAAARELCALIEEIGHIERYS